MNEPLAEVAQEARHHQQPSWRLVTSLGKECPRASGDETSIGICSISLLTSRSLRIFALPCPPKGDE